MTQLRQVKGIATSVRMEGKRTHVRYHQTDVVSFDDERVRCGRVAGGLRRLRCA